MYTKKMNEGTEAQATQAITDSAQANTAEQAALAAGGNSSGGAHKTDAHTLLSVMLTDDLLDHAERGIGLAELASDALLTSGDGMAMLGHCHHALFCRRVDTKEDGDRRDAFHERLHALRQRVSEAKQAQAKEAAPTSVPQPMSGVVDAAVRAMRDEWRADVTHTNNIVQSMAIEMGQLRAAVGELKGDLSNQRECINTLAERVFSMEVPLDRLAKLEARVLALDGIDVIDDAGKVVRRESPKRYPWTGEKDIAHITSEAEMVEAFGEGRGQAMWAECEARKSGGAK